MINFNLKPDLWMARISGRMGLLFLLVLCGCNENEPDLLHEKQIDQWLYLGEEHGLASDYVNTVFEDSKGDFWIGTNRGLSVLRDNKFISYSSADGLLDDNIFAISEDQDGNIWASSRRGVNILRGDRWFYFSFFYNAPVYAMLNLQDETGMLVATGGYGVYKYDYAREAFQRFEYIEGCVACNSINSLFQSKDQSIWLASFKGARKIRGSFITQFDQDDGLPGNIATTISEDSWGNIWIGTVEGKTISKINGNSVSQVSFNNGAEQNFIFGIQEDNNGNLWVGTVDNGLFHYDGAIMKRVEEGPSDDTITCLFKDSRGNLWIGTTEEGLAVYITNPLR